MPPLIALTLAASLAAQPEPDLTKPPETPPIPAYKLPAVQETRLPNGLQISLVEDKRFPLVTARLVFHAGSKFDPKDRPGLAAGTAAVLTEGTKTRSQRQIAEELTSIGGALNASAGADGFLVAGTALAEHLPKLLALMADVTLNATFPKDRVDLYRENRKQALLHQKSQPDFMAVERFAATVYGPANPYSVVAPTVESLDKLSSESVAAFRDAHLLPNNAYLILLGAIPESTQTVKLIEAQFGAWNQGKAPAPPKIDSPAPKRAIVLVDRPGSVQADIHAGQLALTRTHPDHLPLRVGSIILGGGVASRMFNEIRERRGFAYDAHTELALNRDAGTFKAVTQVRNEVIGDAMAELLKLMEQMGRERVKAEELTDAKNFVAGTFLLNLETQAELAGQIAMTKEMGLPLSYLETFTVRIRAVEPDQILAAAKKYIAPDDATIVVVGDASKIGEALKKFGEVSVIKP